jgi:citrate synthase
VGTFPSQVVLVGGRGKGAGDGGSIYVVIVAAENLLTAREAAARLGVKLETLYAYVARGRLRATAANGSGSGGRRRFPASDIDALVARKEERRDPAVAAARALSWGLPVVESAVSSTDGVRLMYRGRDAVKLAEHASYEQVAELLWTGRLGEAGLVWGVERRTWPSPRLPVAAHPIERMQCLLAWLATRDAGRADTSAAGVAATARRMAPRLLGALGAGSLGGPVAARLLVALTTRAAAARDRAAVRLVDRALVLCAEHELNASTFVARVAAGTGADPYAVACAGLATLSGTRHGRSPDLLEQYLRDPARGAIAPGFGHRLYDHGDPRVAPLLDGALAYRGGRERVADLLGVVDDMAARGAPPPNLDLGLLAVATALRLPPGSASAIFAVGRIAGWMAHAIEQYASGTMIRPRARYTGQEDD